MPTSLPVSCLYRPDRFVVLRAPGAARWLMTAAALGDPEAKLALDELVTVFDKHGDPSREDTDAELYWRNRAAALGSADAEAARHPMIPDPAEDGWGDLGYEPDPNEYSHLRAVPGLHPATRQRLITHAEHCRPGATGRAKGPPSLLLYGPPGTGKTMLGGVIARHAGRRFLYADISAWSGAGYLNDHLTAMRGAFAEAAAAAPCLFFLDEIDRFVNRRTGGTYHVQVINAMLEQVTLLRERADVAIVSATNLPEAVDPALLRPGRLGDTRLELPLPDEAGVRDLIARLAPGLPAAALDRFASRFAGSASPADLVMWIEQARATAVGAGAGQRLGVPHLQAAFEQITGIGALEPGVVFRVAVHELGHATVTAALRGSEVVRAISVGPTLSGALGTTRAAPLAGTRDGGVRVNSRDSLIDEIAVVLGGHVAERVFLSAHGGASLGAAADIERGRLLAAAMTAAGLTASDDPAASPFAGPGPAVIIEGLLDRA